MPGTGIHGYTGPAQYGGSYNISNGIITSGSAGTAKTTSGGHVIASRNSPYGEYSAVNDPFTIGASGNDVSSPATQTLSQQIVNAMPDYSQAMKDMAASVANAIGTGQSQYADTIRQLMKISEQNTAKSQQLAREQMAYQTKSDQAAMAWSAQEAQKNRDWQERLSNNAHQREVKDLMAAGLNPILSANAGAYTGSGATGSGFSSSGAMGQVDTSVNGVLGSLLTSAMNSAANVKIAGMYTDAERYAADLQYGSSRLATEASILNNHNSTSAQKEIAYAGYKNDLIKTDLAGRYGLQNTALSNSGAFDRTVYSENAANGRQMNSDIAANYRTNQTNASNERQTESKNASGSWLSAGPYRAIGKAVNEMIQNAQGKYDAAARNFLKNHPRATSSKQNSRLLSQIGWG